MVNTNELKAAIVRKGLTQKEVAKQLNMSERTLTNRFSRGIFGSDEIEKLMNVLDISDPMPIFFAHSVTWQVTNIQLHNYPQVIIPNQLSHIWDLSESRWKNGW